MLDINVYNVNIPVYYNSLWASCLCVSAFAITVEDINSSIFKKWNLFPIEYSNIFHICWCLTVFRVWCLSNLRSTNIEQTIFFFSLILSLILWSCNMCLLTMFTLIIEDFWCWINKSWNWWLCISSWNNAWVFWGDFFSSRINEISEDLVDEIKYRRPQIECSIVEMTMSYGPGLTIEYHQYISNIAK
jgi:hypothetical protein